MLVARVQCSTYATALGRNLERHFPLFGLHVATLSIFVEHLG
jgi:hypothetical protein